MSQTRRSFAIACCLVCSLGALARTPLTFEERVKAQEAIERVCYAHRIWPKENPQPKPPFEQMVPDAQIEAKVTDTLKKCTALDTFWQRLITVEQLQAEMDRMAKGTKDPATLKELFSALKDDPTLIAECLARPVLADRLIHNWYGSDTRFHAGAKEKAERALRDATPENLSAWPEGEYRKTTLKLKTDQESEEENRQNLNEISLDKDEFQKARAKAPEPGRLALQETPEAFVIECTAQASDDSLVLESLTFSKHPFGKWWEEVSSALSIPESDSQEASYALPDLKSSPSPEAEADTWLSSSLSVSSGGPDACEYHTAVWTGTEMIVWGGSCGTLLRTGGRYNPSTDTWTATSTGTNCPSAREFHTAVWTGTEMIVWGGWGSLNTGGRYNPSADTWVATSTGTNCPGGRYWHTAVWTGTVMIIWGGVGSVTYNDGGRYNPSADSWTATSTGTDCPAARMLHIAVWTGTEMLVWGGSNGSYLNTGGRYNPSTDTWTATSTGTNCPSARRYQPAVWTGTEMIVWGGQGSSGYINTGGRYNPSADTWTATSTGTNCPSARFYHTAVWTGTEMAIWGGRGSSYKADGGRYTPSTDTWAPTSTGTNCVSARYHHTAVWTGTEMIVWGGYDGAYDGAYLNTGGRYNPSTDNWTATSTGNNCPSTRSKHAAVWTGMEMIVWGGSNGAYPITSGRYDPSTDAWTATSTGTNCPEGRTSHTLVWTGTEMVVWGGYPRVSPYYINTGGRYNPSTNTWAPTSTGTSCPSARNSHTAVWTGTEMMIWGGIGPSSKADGGRYNPSADTWAPISNGTNCPSARAYHTAVWTGTEMIVWGGGAHLITGGKYDPSTDTWKATSEGISGRLYHTAVWTGTKMLVWGGYDGLGYPSMGGLYNPSVDTWAPTSMGDNCPTARRDHTAVWTGTEMILWGGYNGAYLNTGGRYDPSADAWAATSTGENCPSGRRYHTAVWTGTRMIIWAGATDPSENTKTGGLYNPYACAAPPAPDAPTFTAVSCNSMTVNWVAVTGATTYDLWRAAGASCTSALKINATPIGGLAYNDTVLTESTEYSYFITANNTCGTSENGICASSTTTPPISAAPAAPTFTAVACISETVNWTTVAGATTYDVWRAAGATCTGAVSIATGISGLTYHDTGLNPGTQYGYYLVAVNACGSSPDGACASMTTLTGCAPEEVSSGTTSATAQAWAADKTTMSWTLDATATGYRLYRGVPADLPNLVTSAVDSCTRYDGAATAFNLNATNDQPASGTFLWFLVTAYNGIGEGSAGNTSAVPRIVNSAGVCP